MHRTNFVAFFGAAVLLGVTVTACGSPAGAKDMQPQSAATQDSAPSSTAPAAAPGAAAAPASGTPTAASTFVSALPTDASPLLKRGEILFQVEAGGAGCQMCHGREAKGLIGPNIRGKNALDVADAIQTRELMMTAIGYLPQDDLEAVATYLAYLADQP